MSLADEDFAGLLQRARQGDEQALRALAEQYEKEVRIVARVQLGPALRPYLDSVDLVQSVHKSLLMGIRQNRFDISSPDKLIALALTIVRRKVARQWRRLRRQQRISYGAGEGSTLPDLLASLSATEADPVRAAQLRDALQQLWENVNDTEKRVLELRLQGYSTVEAARQLNLDADVLRVRLSRLRQRLRAGGVLTEWL
jgi:RNA polymerase sigma factor (sigma-70 family)